MKSVYYILIVFTFLISSCSYIKKPKGEKIEKIQVQNISELTDSDRIDSLRIHDFFYNKFKFKAFSGTILYAKNGKVIYKNALGYKSIKSKDSLKIDDSFQLASVSKPFTAIGIMKLVEAGKLNLDDRLDSLLPLIPYEGITVKMLLTHRSGLPNYMYFCDRIWDGWNSPISNESVCCIMNEHSPELYYYPNKRYNYSNTGYLVLASIIEKVSGMSYGEYMQKKVFEPLQMEKTFVFNAYLNPTIKEKGVIGHESNGRPSPDSYLNGTVGDKNIYSTVEDMFKLDQALRNYTFLKKETIDLMYEPLHEDLYINDNYGLGWRIDASDENNKIVYHHGWWKGFKTYFIREQGSGKTIIVLTNHTKGGFLKSSELKSLF